VALIDIIRDKAGLSGFRSRLADDLEAQTLFASIMVISAKSDGGISPEENLRMVQLLRGKFGVQPGEALELVTRLADSVTGNAETDSLIDTVNREFSLSAKEELMLMVVSVIAADEEKDAQEMKLLMSLVDELNVPGKVMEKVYARYFEQQKIRGQVSA
jgi:uncharacterized tellurite resistance protein B-like protein